MSEGACLCGAVRFEVEAPYRWFAFCHCSMCRKQYGALFGAGVGVERSRFAWLAGSEAIVRYRATAAFDRPFCRHCGSNVPAASHLPDVMLVPAGTLDADFTMKPRAHIFAGSRSPLTVMSDRLRRYETYPPGVDLPVVDRQTERPAGRVPGGSCLCGTVAYEVHAALEAVLHCHCSLCRRSRGAPFATTAFVSAERFSWTRGEDLVGSYRLPPPRAYRTDFCTLCGSVMPSLAQEAGLALIPAGGLDTPVGPLPGAHVYVGSKADWDEIDDELPRYEQMPPPERLAELFP